MERRDSLHGLGPQRGASGCAHERKFPCTGIHLFDPGDIRSQASAHHFLSFLQHRALLRVCKPQAQLPTFLSALSVPGFHILTQGWARFRAPSWVGRGRGRLCCVKQPLCFGRQIQEPVEVVGQSWFYFVEKEISTLLCLCSLISMQEGDCSFLKHCCLTDWILPHIFGCGDTI